MRGILLFVALSVTIDPADASRKLSFVPTLSKDLLDTFTHFAENCGVQDDGGCCTGLGFHYCQTLNKCVPSGECPIADECCMFEHVEFKGRSLCLQANSDINSQAIDLRQHSFDDRISSIRCTGDAFIAAYEHLGASGDFRVFTGAIPDLRPTGPDECTVYVDLGVIDPSTGYTRIYYGGSNPSRPAPTILRPDGLDDQITSVQVLNGAGGFAFAIPMYLYTEGASEQPTGSLYGANAGARIPVSGQCGTVPVRAPYDCGLSEIIERYRGSQGGRRQLKLAGAALGAAYAQQVQAEISKAIVDGKCGTVPVRPKVGESCTGGSNRWCLQSFF